MSEFLRLFTRAHKLLRAETDQALSRYGVRVGQNLVLEVLWETDGLTPGELAGRLGVATPTVVKSASRMAEAGLLVRRRDESDARLVRLYLTDHARVVREPIEADRERLERRVTDSLNAEQRDLLRAALRKIIDELSGDGPNAGEWSRQGGSNP
jgi:MarR family transcriptional regulator, organic hydroperoxide resistance regulator